ncbi:hypothetical protein C8F01DRAFT_1162859 [Mycena amicta]|nr:hypothetical protein C8F01DRAFT_1162859 [Mycena amicta]
MSSKQPTSGGLADRVTPSDGRVSPASQPPKLTPSSAPLQYLMFTEGTSSAASMRHAYWILFTNTYDWKPTGALGVVGYNTLLNTVNTLVTVNALTSSPLPILGEFKDCIGWKQWAGVALFATGIAIEMVAEATRRAFKKNPQNKGKIDDTGLW